MRFVGWLAMILGVVGIVVCLGIAVGVWMVRPAVDDAVDQVVAVAADGMEQVDEVADSVRTSLDQVSTSLESIATQADAIAAAPTVDPIVAAALQTALQRLEEGPVGDVASQAALLRQRVTTLSTTVQRLDDALPFVSLPGVVTGAVDDLDARLAPLDQAVARIRQAGSAPAISTEQAAAIGAAATGAAAQVDDITESLGSVHLQVEEIHAQVASAGEQVQGMIGTVAILISIVAIWVGLLHLLLVAQGRRWARSE